MTTYRYEVAGHGVFAFDMLRYDAAWPETSSDAGKLEHHRVDTRRVRLLSAHKPTMERWASFAWPVTGPVEKRP